MACALALAGSDPAETVFQRAASALSAKDYGAAERGFLAVLKMQPGNVGALGNLGVVYSRTNRLPAAIDSYKRALRFAPSDRALATNLGLAYVKEQQFASALPIFEKLAVDRSNLQAAELLATCRLSLGQYREALAALHPLVSAEASEPGVYYMLGVALTKLKRADEAHAAYATMMQLVSPAQANYLMGKASYETGNFNEAADLLRKALVDESGLVEARRELGKTLFSLSDFEGAEKELRQGDLQDPDTLYYLGASLVETHSDEAVSILQKASQLNPDFWGPLYYLARVYVDRGRVGEGIQLLQRAAKLDPAEPAIQYRLGKALQKAGREAETKAAFARVQQLKAQALQKELDAISPNAK